jgi:hypothetical protein
MWDLLDQAGDETRKALLVNHELSHCVLGLGHNQAVSNNCPADMMYPSLISNDCLARFPERYTLQNLGEK